MSGETSDTVDFLENVAPGDTFEMIPGSPIQGVFLVNDPNGTGDPAPTDRAVTRLSDGARFNMNAGIQVLRVPYSYAPTV